MFGQQDPVTMAPDPCAERTAAALEGILAELGSVRVQLAELANIARRPRPRGPLDPPVALRRR
jgi:hypothetical protein